MSYTSVGGRTLEYFYTSEDWEIREHPSRGHERQMKVMLVSPPLDITPNFSWPFTKIIETSFIVVIQLIFLELCCDYRLWLLLGEAWGRKKLYNSELVSKILICL